MQDLQRREERRDWSRIPPALLLACEEGLPYLGAEAFRFLMPAYMMLDLKYHPDEVLGSMRLAGMSGILTTSSPETVAFFTQRFADFSPPAKRSGVPILFLVATQAVRRISRCGRGERRFSALGIRGFSEAGGWSFPV